MRLFVTDRWEAYKGPIKTLFECVDTREVNGENALTVSSLAALDKGDRIVWQDLKGRWHENVVDGIEEERAKAGILYTYYCITSAQEELRGDYLEDKRPYGTDAATALASALSSSRWTVGTVASLGVNSTNFYHTNAWAAVHDVADTWGGELYFEITVSGTKVTSRKVSLAKQVGEDTGKRFTYSKDLASVVRTVDEGSVVTALYGFGKSLESTDDEGNLTGGYDRKLTFGDVNGGQNWVGDADALALFGRPDGNGGKAHVFGDVEFSECEDADELLALTKAQLAESCVPAVSYKVDAISLARAGEGFEGADEGDLVTVIDKCYDPPLRVRTRITKVEEDQLREGVATYTFGNYTTAADLLVAQKSSIGSATSTMKATITDAVNASNKASNSKWGETLQATTGELHDTLVEYTNTTVEQSEAALKEIDEANKKYLEGITDSLDASLDAATEKIEALQAELDKVPEDIREQIVDMLNAEINTTGGWVYEEPGTGILIYDKKPPNATQVVKIGGGVIGVANSKYSSGSWKYTTAINGSGINADTIYTGRITGGNSYFDLDSGKIQMRDGSILITDSGGNKVYIDATNGFQVRNSSGSIIAGTVIVNNVAMFRCNMVGTSSTNYITTGTTTDGKTGFTCVSGTAKYFEVGALYADDDTTKATSGAGLSTMGYGFLDASRYYRHIRIVTPYYTGFMTHPNEQLYLRSGNNSAGSSAYVALQFSDSRGLFLTGSQTWLEHDSTHGLWFKDGYLYIRNGTYGVRLNSSGEWESRVWS